LLNVGSNIATKNEKKKKRIPQVTVDDVYIMESLIDDCDSKNEKLTVFLLVGTNSSDSQCHVCRSICRRVERGMWKLERDENYGVGIDENILKYMNRLSDFFFAFARNLS
jgi:cob(I)alamin adenosyltransferase